MKYSLTLLALLFLAACSSSIPPGTQISLNSSSLATSIFMPAPETDLIPSLESAANKVPYEQWKVTLDQEAGFTMRYPAVYPVEDPKILPGLTMHDASSPCSPSLTGASQTTDLLDTGGKTVWGRFTSGDMIGPGAGWPNAFCQPPQPSPECRQKHKNGQFCDDGTRTYALCSEKDNKTVVICISQMKENEALAKQIFETFRWTK